MRPELAPNMLLAAYATGIVPMADEDGQLVWLAPDLRAIIELDAFKVSRSLRSTVRRAVFRVTVNEAFSSVIEACADRSEGTWISPEIKKAYTGLHELGYAHSVEAWAAEELVGGLYGVSLGGAFFGESMFQRRRDASKVALVHLVECLRDRGFVLLDVQFMTDHLKRFGAVEIPRDTYEQRLEKAIRLPVAFAGASASSSATEASGSDGGSAP